MTKNQFTLKSEDRASGTPESFVWQTNGNGNLVLKNVRSIKLVGAQIPNSWYLVRTGYNDTLVMQINGTYYTATVPAGNYNISTLLTALVSSMNAAFASGGYSASYSSSTNLITFTQTYVTFPTILIYPNSFSPYSTIYALIGLTQNTYILNGGNMSGTMSQPFNLSGVREIYVYIQEFNNQQRTSSKQDQPTFTVPVTSSYGEMIDYKSCEYSTDEDFNKYAFHNDQHGNELRQLTVRITDTAANNTAFSLNGADFSLYFQYAQS